MKHPFYFGWVIFTLGLLLLSNFRGWRLLPGAAHGPRYPHAFAGSGSGGSRSFGGSFHK